ncbi:helix-turn-helix domain-containing protein [uncultured Sulfitobacter sp.]|uniref:GlxA family transcriptional regulator n=1 Tax=uncultured Sulfitobacter sp. TaxID=191468 RepID=UPI0030DB754F|tara:strand:+ start:288 stop:1235 length:948 start_codon:yes stop_codon:yes gene_type:complete
MQEKTKSSGETVKIDILLFDGFSNHCLANTLEPFRAANSITGQARYDWRLLSLEGGLVRSSSGMLVQTELAMATKPPCDYLMVTASYGHLALSSSQVLSALRGLCANAKCLVGLDMGAWLLAAAGLLDNRPATIHGHLFESFSETFPQIDARQERFVIDGNRITCGGAMASFDLVLTLIGAHCGEITRLDVASLFLHRSDQSFGEAGNISGRSKLVSRALVLMDETIEAPVSIPTIARHLGCSLKSLQRRFARSLNATPGQVYRHRRLIAAKSLAEGTNLSISEIATRCGYENASSMTRAFKTQFGTTPMDLRAD